MRGGPCGMRGIELPDPDGPDLIAEALRRREERLRRPVEVRTTQVPEVPDRPVAPVEDPVRSPVDGPVICGACGLPVAPEWVARTGSRRHGGPCQDAPTSVSSTRAARRGRRAAA